MLFISTPESGCKDSCSEPSPFKALCSALSRNLSTPQLILARISASGLVLASAGMGAVYAWSVGSQYGVVLAVFMTLMAVALEIAKPLSLAAAFRAFKSQAIPSGIVLALLALVAISYSLTAELTLVSGVRGDVIAKRGQVLQSVTDAEADIKRAKQRYDDARADLASLPATRSASEVQGEIDKLLLTPGAEGCVQINGKVTRSVCPKVAELRIEKARAERKAELEAIVATPLPKTQSTGQAVQDSDPGASALATYLAAAGIEIPTDILSAWLSLVPVVALELGSAFAGVLVQSVAPANKFVTSESVKTANKPFVEPLGGSPMVQPTRAGFSDDAVRGQERVKSAILDQLKNRGGSVQTGERGLALSLGAKRSTVRRALNGLVMAGLIAAEASRNGTMLRLVS